MIYHYILPVIQFLLSALVVILTLVIAYKIEIFFDNIFGKDSWTSRFLCIPGALVTAGPNDTYNKHYI